MTHAHRLSDRPQGPKELALPTLVLELMPKLCLASVSVPLPQVAAHNSAFGSSAGNIGIGERKESGVESILIACRFQSSTFLLLFWSREWDPAIKLGSIAPESSLSLRNHLPHVGCGTFFHVSTLRRCDTYNSPSLRLSSFFTVISPYPHDYLLKSAPFLIFS